MASKNNSPKKASLDAKQKLALDVLKQNPALSATGIAKQLGWPEDTVRQWYRRDTNGFKAKWDEALHDAFDRLEGLAIQCMGDLIVNGNFNAAKYVLDNKGYAAPKKIEAEVNANQTITITIEE
jgi:hypothetical protein